MNVPERVSALRHLMLDVWVCGWLFIVWRGICTHEQMDGQASVWMESTSYTRSRERERERDSIRTEGDIDTVAMVVMLIVAVEVYGVRGVSRGLHIVG